MENMTIEKLLANLAYLNNEEIKNVIKAYNFAKMIHNGQYRKSGELYITHPLSVAYILTYFKADSDTLAAAILHDVIEDSNITKNYIEEMFGETIATLVDGVTKIRRESFETKEEQNNANTRKLIMGLKIDPRIIVIKLADRLHNMLTMEYQREIKQIENSYETIEIFSPLAYHTGILEMKRSLEELSLPYIDKNSYNKIITQNRLIVEKNELYFRNITQTIRESLLKKEIDSEIKPQIKNIYEIYKKIKEGASIEDIHDFFSIQIIVDDIKKCYKTEQIIESMYSYITSEFNDYIATPKGNMYQALHLETINNGINFKVKIRTKEMDKVDTLGIASYWELYEDNAIEKMQEDLNNKFYIYNKLIKTDNSCSSDKEFVKKVKHILHV